MIIELKKLGSAWPFEPLDPSVRRARYTIEPSAKRKKERNKQNLTLQRGQKRRKNASGRCLITFLISTPPEAQFILFFAEILVSQSWTESQKRSLEPLF